MLPAYNQDDQPAPGSKPAAAAAAENTFGDAQVGIEPFDAAQDAISNALGNLGGIEAGVDEPSVEASGAGGGTDLSERLDGLQGIMDEGSQLAYEPGTIEDRRDPQPEDAAPAPAETPATPEDAQLQSIAEGITVTPEMVAAFKAENPLFAQMDDATAGSALKDILAYAVQSERNAAVSGAEPKEEPGRSSANGFMGVPSAALGPLAFLGLGKPVAAGVAKSGLETYDAVNEIALGNDPSQHSEWRQGIENYYANLHGISGVAAGIAQWGVSFVGIGKFAKLAKVPGLARTATTRLGVFAQGAAKGAATDFIAFDGMEGRLSDLVQKYPNLQNPVTEYLATKPDDTQAEGRLKNALEGLGIGATVDVVLAGFRAIRAHRAGDKAAVDAAVDDGVKRFDELNAPQPTGPVDELRAANDDPKASPQTFTESPTPQKTMSGTPEVANDTVKAIDDAIMSPSLPREELEAASSRMAQRVAEDPKAPLVTPEIGQPIPSTFDSLTQADDLRAIVDATEQQILKGIEGSATAKGSVSVEEAQRLAKEFAEMTGQDQGLFYVRMARDAGSIENLHARLLAYDQVTRTLAVEVRDMAHAVKAGEPGTYGSIEALKDAFENKLAAYAQVQDWLKGVRSETGRTLAIMRHSQKLGQGIDVSGVSALGRGRGAGIGPFGGNVTVEELADAVITAGTDRKLLGEVASPTRYAMVRDALVSLFIKNILSGPTTQLVNIIGNVSSTIAHPAQKIIGGAASRDLLTMREGVKQYGFMLSESTHALKMALEAYKRNINILDPSRSKFHGGAYPEALTAHNITGGMVPDDSVTGWLANGAFKAIDAVSTRALSASDEFFKQSLYASELTARAWADGVAQGLEGDALRQYVKRERDLGFTTAPDVGPNTANAAASANAAAALEVARFNTFTQNVKPGGIASSILYATNRYPELKFAVPFVRVVSNLLQYTGTMTPGIASRMEAYKEAINRGGRDAAVAKGRLAMGYALWTTAMSLAAAGQLTGAGPVKSDGSPDYKKRQMLAQSGWKPNALKAGGTYIDLARLDPFGLPFNIAAQAYEKFQMGMREEKDWLDIAGSMSFALGHVMLDRQYLKGLADFFEAMNDDTGYKMTAYVANIASSIAVPNFIRQTVTVQNDPLMREARGFVESIMRRTPFVSEQLASRRMPWGQKMELQPSLYSKETDDQLMKEYGRLLLTGDSGAGEPLPRMKIVPGGKSIDLTRFKLSTGESLYDVYGDLIEQPDPSVEPLTQVLRGLIESDAYKNEMIDGAAAFKGTRLKAWQTIMARYRAAAWRTIIETYPEVREQVYGANLKAAERLAAQRDYVSGWLEE